MRMPFSIFRLPSFAGSAVCLLAAAALIGCASKDPVMTKSADQSASGVETGSKRRLLGFLSPYRPDVQQGNFVSGEMVKQLQIGMTPDQVRFILGTPLLTDMFHENRWDYVFRLEQGSGRVIASRVTVHFKDSRLAKIDSGELPSEEAYLSLIAGAPPAPKPAAK